MKMKWDNMFAKETSAMGINMTLIGGWSDLAGYYRGSDGNAWSFQGRWSNNGPCIQFIERLQAGKIRGELITPKAVDIAEVVVQYPNQTFRCNI